MSAPRHAGTVARMNHRAVLLDVPEHFARDPFNAQTLAPAASQDDRRTHVHQQFALSSAGIYGILRMFHQKAFGCCPRVLCDGQALLPQQCSASYACAGYCPLCRELYNVPELSATDGRAYGLYAAHAVEVELAGNLGPVRNSTLCAGRTFKSHQRRLFGFALHDAADSLCLQRRPCSPVSSDMSE